MLQRINFQRNLKTIPELSIEWIFLLLHCRLDARGPCCALSSQLPINFSTYERFLRSRRRRRQRHIHVFRLLYINVYVFLCRCVCSNFCLKYWLLLECGVCVSYIHLENLFEHIDVCAEAVELRVRRMRKAYARAVEQGSVCEGERETGGRYT